MSKRNSVAPVILTLFIVLLAAQHGWSQEARGRIQGLVSDSSGAAIAGATVDIENVATGSRSHTESNQQGLYVAPFLNVGTYTVRAEKAGFKKFLRQGITVQVGDNIEINIQLELGELTQTVEVTEELPLLRTTDASVGRVVDTQRMALLPIAHGNPMLLIRLAPNVNFNGSFNLDQPYEPLSNVNFAMAGSVPARGEFSLDGASNTVRNSATRDIIPAFTPPSDAVQEYKIEVASFDASTAQTEGGVTNLVMKSGTNKPHGTFYWTKQSASLNANDFYANRVGQPKAFWDYNRLGGMASGPVMIPHLYDGRNRTFFMVSLEWIRQQDPRGGVFTVPTDAEKTGDYSALLKLGSNYQIYDPFSWTAAGNGRFQSTPLAGNLLPANRMSPIAKSILGYYPGPNTTGTADGHNNYSVSTWPERIAYNAQVFKFDESISDYNKLFFRFNWAKRKSHDSDQFGFDNPSIGAVFWYIPAGFALGDTHTFNSTTVLDMRLSDSRFIRAQDANEIAQGFQLTSLGFPQYLQNAIPSGYQRFPVVSFSDGTSPTGSRTPLWRPGETRAVAGTIIKVVGVHSMKFGVEYREYVENQYAATANAMGTFSEAPAYTVGPFDNSAAAPFGQGLAQMQMGLLNTASLDLVDSFADRSSVWGFFYQDSWKAARNLTLNLGVRYEWESANTERFNRQVKGFDPNYSPAYAAQVASNYLNNPVAGLSQLAIKGGVTFPGVGGNSNSLWNTDKNNIMPRVGLAWNVTKSTVVRAGFGVYFGAMGVRRMPAIQNGFSQTTNSQGSLDGGLTYAATLANPFPFGFQQPRGSSAGGLSYVGNAETFFNQNPIAPRLRKFQVDIQRMLPGSFMVDLGYLNSRGDGLELTRNLNGLPVSMLSTSPVRDTTTNNYLTGNIPNPFAGVSAFNSTPLQASLIPRCQLFLANPQYYASGCGAVTPASLATTNNDGNSWYDSVNVLVERRWGSGFTFQFAYTRSKFIEQTLYLNALDPKAAKALSTNDFPNHITVSSVYELPLGKGKKFLSGAHGISNSILGGWTVSGIYTYQSGQAMGFGDAIFTCSSMDQAVASSPTITNYFNKSCFNTASAQQLVYHFVTLSPRFNSVRGFPYNYLDANAQKTVKIKEGLGVEFRADFLNALNHPNFNIPATTSTQWGATNSPSSGTFGTITSVKNLPRRIQLNLHFRF